MFEQLYLILSGATTPGQSGSGSNGKNGVINIPESSKAEASSSDCLVSYPGRLSGSLTPLQR